jgi:biopolymer transport protein ExbD
LNEEVSHTPFITGIFKPKIFLPRFIIETWNAKEIEPVLMHELAHIKRNDLLVNWIQIIIQSLFFFHPMVWYANSRIREAREEVCDDIAIHWANNQRRQYSQSILQIIEGIITEKTFSFVDAGFSEGKESLAKRLIRIARGDYKFYKPMNLMSYIILVFITVFSFSLACEHSPDTIIGNEVISDESVKKEPIHISIPIKQERVIIEVVENGKYKVDNVAATSSDLNDVFKQTMEKSNKKDITIFVKNETTKAEINYILDTAYGLGAKHILIKTKTESSQ